MYKRVAVTMFDKFGFNVLPLRGKKPIIEWDKWQTEKQTIDDINNMPWGTATGLGAMMKDGLRLFDIDGVEDYEILDWMLEELGLPENYPWIIKSGGGGLHIYFISPNPESKPAEIKVGAYNPLDKLGGEKAVYKFRTLTEGLCKHVELRWQDCQTALPTSMHESGGIYRFYNDEPTEAPAYIEVDKVISCLEKLCKIETDAPLSRNSTTGKNYFYKERLESALNFLGQHLSDGCYEDWYKIGFALVPLGKEGEEYFLNMSLANPHYSDNEATIRKKFEDLARDYNGSITFGTIFHIAEMNGWRKPIIKFWKVENNGNVKIILTSFKRLLESEGFYKYKIGSNYILVKITDKIVEEINSISVKDFISDYLSSFPIEDFEGTSRTGVLNALIKGANQFFSNQFLEFLCTRTIDFNKDTKESSFFYYSNRCVEVTAERIRFREYSEIDGYIWKQQIIDRKFTQTKSRSDFEECFFNVCRKEIARFNSLKSAIGYSLHRFKDPTTTKAVIFMDERLSDGAFGRSGKGLLIQGLGKIRNVEPQDSRNFNPSKNFAFQRIFADTNLIAFQDLRENFPFDKLFSIITDGLTVERKNKDEIYLPFPESPKILITTNYSLRGLDDSSLGRQFILEFSDHYNARHAPVDEFGRIFFEEWDEEEWSRFDNFMIECAQYYLKNGLVKYEYVNLERKRLIDETCPEFAEFSDSLELNHKYDKKKLCISFKTSYEDFNGLSQGKFSKWLKVWARIKDYNVTEGKSGANRTIIFSQLSKAA